MSERRMANMVIGVLSAMAVAFTTLASAHTIPADVAAYGWIVSIAQAGLTAAAYWINTNATPTGTVVWTGRSPGDRK